MKFSYRAIKEGGQEEAGEREAVDRFALAHDLRTEGLTLVAVKELATTAGEKKRFASFNFFGRVKVKDKIIFASSLSAMISAGLSLSRALSVIERQTANKKFHAVITSLIDKISAGNSLSQALGSFPEVFPPVFIAMVGAGEESGNLPQSLETVRQQMSKSYDLTRKVKGAMIYPAVIMTAIFVVGILMMIFVVPTITQVFKDFKATLPLSTRFIIAVSDFVSGHTLIFLTSLTIFIVGCTTFLRTGIGRSGRTYVVMRLPAISQIVRNFNAAVTLRTISSLISSGVSMIQTLAIASRVIQNPYYREVLESAVVNVEKGLPLSGTFKAHEDIYPILVGEMTEVGEETGNLTGMMLKAAEFFEEEVDQATKNLSTIIEPALMILIGLAVGFFAVSIIGPIYSLSSTI